MVRRRCSLHAVGSSSPSRRRGAVLIVVLGILVVLALLATTFSTLQAVERDVSRNYLDGVRSRLVAQSGIEDAMGRLSVMVARGRFEEPALQYWGANTSEVGAPDWATPLERAANPSYAIEDEVVQNPLDPLVAPRLFTVDGRKLGISGTMSSSTYAPEGDVYRLRVSDANARIHVNDGIENGPEGYVSQNLKRVLNTLGELVGVSGAGDKIVGCRPPGGYRLRGELEAGLGPADYARLRPFVTTAAWVDPNVVNPVPLSSETLASYPVKYNQQIGVFRYARSFAADGKPLAMPLLFAPEHADPAGNTHGVMALDELGPQWIEICRRAPVNVNLAPKEVLTALVAGLRGVFLVERRKHNPAGSMYSFLNHRVYDNAPLGQKGDEIGFLYSTAPFLKPGETAAGGGVSAVKVAEEIIACRNRERSPSCPEIDYGKVWYGGPFRTWRQFHAFCDGLAGGGLLKDERPIFFDYQPAGAGVVGPNSGPDTLIPSAIQARLAAQALADVLKANFNPNFTPNEINPDHNLHLLVDKSDLLAVSTEFCFSPMGIFEIESEGLIVRTPRSESFLACRQGTLVARHKVSCVAKLFDVYRETAQSEFQAGKISAREAGPATEGERTLVLGPEPDPGKAAEECGWSGWIQLAPVGGSAGHDGPEMDDALHGHFSGEVDLHFHAGGRPQALRPRDGDYRNNPDRTEKGGPGPYVPAGDGRYRLARAWRQEAPPEKPETAASGDLRIDGAYVERDSALLYANGPEVFDLVGTVAYWIKPSYRPEMTGKPRTYFSMDRMIQSIDPFGKTKMVQLINAHWLFASQDAPAFEISGNEPQIPRYRNGPWRPVAMLAGYSTHGRWGGGLGTESFSLNHRAHPHEDRTDYLRANGWIHVAYYWDMRQHITRLVINGKVVPPVSNDIRIHPQKFNKVEDFVPAPIRIGEPSRTMAASTKVSRNWAADATVDEFYLWKGERIDEAQALWARGRYYLPRKGKEASFTSREITLQAAHPRYLPPPSRKSASTVTRSAPPVQVLGAAWTWYPESVDDAGKPVLWDCQAQDLVRRGEALEAEVELAFVVNTTATGSVLRDDGGSPVWGILLNPGDKLQYRLEFRLPKAGLDTVLLATPVVDDVTIYYTSGTELLSYAAEGVAR